ncbi:ribbon-helix-helix domain-containing protein [Serinibacter arcticus]|uniref:Ribbon-helix-helix protein CopG domain-containing protein n=1 Tax=Serinibacter arcticus TaxID=1655435 RepID=A0A4Z1DZA3_9MICO|nr:CopG family transcriptional regulator [Serinibacter arcticus]TGO04995.1 hypothetical protein SERN_0999 [Serinibacter arcticus]
MLRTNIYLEARQTEALDELARAAGVTRAEMIRRVVDRALAGASGAEESALAAIDLSFGAVTAVEVAERGPDERAAHLAALWGRDA